MLPVNIVIMTDVHPQPSHEEERLKALYKLDILDTPPDERLDAITYYLENLPTYTPTNGENFEKGIEVFSKIGCTSCHVPSLKAIDGTSVYTFSDLLLHDMGEGLSDGRVEFQAQENEFSFIKDRPDSSVEKIALNSISFPVK